MPNDTVSATTTIPAPADAVFAVLSDPRLELARALDLPTFAAGEERLYKRLTLVVTDGAIEHAFYPIFPPDRHAAEVLDWLRAP